jgi:hypothetical protein
MYHTVYIVDSAYETLRQMIDTGIGMFRLLSLFPRMWKRNLNVFTQKGVPEFKSLQLFSSLLAIEKESLIFEPQDQLCGRQARQQLTEPVSHIRQNCADPYPQHVRSLFISSCCRSILENDGFTVC